MGENTGKSYISDKILISNIYKRLVQRNSKKKSLNNKWAQDLNRYCFKEKTYRWPTGA